MSAHTRGPWVVDERGIRAPAAETGTYSGWTALVVKVDYGRMGNAPCADADKANAAFIVRACNAHDELLAALREYVRADAALRALPNEPGKAWRDAEAQYRAAVTDARAAIAKAEGNTAA